MHLLMAPLSRRKQFLLWVVAAVVATAGLITILVREHRPSASRHALYVIGIPEKGAVLFFGEKHCSICHAVNGSGGRVAPDLGRIRPGKPAMAWLATVLWNHAPGMWRQLRGAQPPDLNQEEMAHILAFLYQAGTSDPAGDVATGERVFAAKGCAHCHSPSNSGHLAPDLSHVAASGDTAAWMHAMWNHAQYMIEPITREIGQWPQFQGDEMNDLIAYVSRSGGAASLPAGGNGSRVLGSAERGWQVFQAECIACHSVGGMGGHTGPELGPEHDLPHSSAQFAAVLWNHAPAMLKQVRAAQMTPPTLQGNEITDVLQFLTSLRYFEPSGSPFLGERVFAERGCALCHGSKAEGTKEGPRIAAGADAFTTVSLASALWRHGPAMRVRTERLGIAWPTLEATDVGDLISFLNERR
jgi:mono/diheme cytochrome c family protein